ncbi:MAG: carbon storage regulator [Bryobacterales bacterium]|nr:carbon storage regulator [Bryobacterales bacterium]
MLVIRRRPGEAFFVGEDVEIRIVELNAHRVVLGIVAPQEVPILRGEIRQAAEQNQLAAQTTPRALASSIAAHLRQNPAR